MSVFTDRDYHVHHSGSVSKELIHRWHEEGLIGGEDLFDTHHDADPPFLSVQHALQKYRKGLPLVEAYQAPYDSLDDFITMYRAYAPEDLCREYTTEICKGLDPRAEIRCSVPPPEGEPLPWAKEAIDTLHFYQENLLPNQRLVIAFERMFFNNSTHMDHLRALLSLLQDNAATIPRPCFDFVSKIYRVPDMIEVLEEIRKVLPESTVLYHHGEMTSAFSLLDRIQDAERLLPYVNRIGHGICLGVAPPGSLERKEADRILRLYAERGVGIEINPTCNLTLGGASDLSYCKRFLDHGVNLYLGTDDPGFLNTTLDQEREILEAVLAQGK